jgi:hypothetical protein
LSPVYFEAVYNVCHTLGNDVRGDLSWTSA